MGDGLKRAKAAAKATQAVARDKMIAAGVLNLKQYGYPHVDAANILTDKIYKSFFIFMLRDNYGNGFDDDVSTLLKELGEETQR